MTNVRKILMLAALSLPLVPADPVLAVSSQTLIAPKGAAPGDFFGLSVSSAGDMNGDGFDDVIVGAARNDAAGADAGSAYIYYGGSPPNPNPDITLTGAAAGDEFGVGVSGAGDVNGDGYDDVIVGAFFSDAGGTDAGSAYVYFGGPVPNAVPDLTLTGAAPGDFFGYSVASAGDVNGDGYADLIVGAFSSDAGVGRAYVYYGGPAPNAVADLTLTGAAAGDFFGQSVSSAGDANADGYGDVIVGANGNDAGGTNAGCAYVFFGGESADTVADLTMTGPAGSRFGAAVRAAGDVNGDGYMDVIVGTQTESGRAFVYYGGPGLDAAADWALTGAPGTVGFGISVDSAGDMNGDGFDDVIVGAIQSASGGTEDGSAQLFHGGVAPDGIPELIVIGAAAGDVLGISVSRAGDVNGDGHADVVVGAYGNDESGSDAGSAYVITAPPFKVIGPNGGEQWVSGTNVTVRWEGSGPADIALSTDGGLTYAALAIGVVGAITNQITVMAPFTPSEGAKVRIGQSGQPVSSANSDASDGVFSIVRAVMPPSAAARLQFTPTGAAANDRYGYSVSSAGDVNGDGFADVIVGAFQNDAGGTDAGRAYLYYGGSGADLVADLTLTGATTNDFFGVSVSGAGDVNGDGYADVIVGAQLSEAGGTNAGSAYVFYGGSAPDAVADLTLTGAAANDHFGYSVSGAGDVNGDGYADVIVGAHANATGGVGAGRAYVYYGGPGADAVADLTLTGAAVIDNFGYSVSDAGDVNGDGYGDVIVGATGNDAGGPNAGGAFIYYGGPAADAVADLILTGAAANDQLGYSVSSAGDLNGDGFADMIAGAWQNDAGGADAGRAYVYYGGPGADATADLTLTGEAANDNFGVFVSNAGDVNGDGRSDVIVGAYGNDAKGEDAGRAYVYFGGPGADALADLTLTGEAAGDRFGVSASGAGDVNGDGHSDVIVGAWWNDAGGAYAGRAYVYDVNRYHLLSPIGGETWNVGAIKTISWLGTEPALVSLSTDGGQSYQPLFPSASGGDATNAVAVRVPHTPSKFARVRITPVNSVGGFDQSDSLFTIQTSVSLLSMLAAALPHGGATITWQSNPGPEDLSGYRLEKAAGGSEWRTLVGLTRETSVTDPEGGPGSRYRLLAVNGFGEELWLGEASLRPARPLAAWPLPYRSGAMTITFATGGGLGGGRGAAEVAIYDVSGRLVRRIARGEYAAGYQSTQWDGRDGRGQRVSSGIYFLRSVSGGEQRTLRLSVLR